MDYGEAMKQAENIQAGRKQEERIQGAYGTTQEQKQVRHGSPAFYQLLDKMKEIHSLKSHDYASNADPMGNYHFAGMMSKMFNNPDDVGFVGRLGEKIYRLANLENNLKVARNESIQDTELDICVITMLWMTDRMQRREKDIPKGKLYDDRNPNGPISSGVECWTSSWFKTW